ncbi:hypothetical protein [Streptomyces sp. NPDC002054]|uniref:hypothetical protein n=1 Tax=Streptomyces sp. NPDC002054 TaxID=3154663 RepID=UPI00332B3125
MVFESLCEEGEEWCADARTTGLDHYGKADAMCAFFVITYRDEKSAAAAYDGAWQRQNLAGLADRTPVRLGNTGGRQDAERGTQKPKGQRVSVQIQIGRALLQINLETLPDATPLSDGEVAELAARFAERARKAQGLR